MQLYRIEHMICVREGYLAATPSAVVLVMAADNTGMAALLKMVQTRPGEKVTIQKVTPDATIGGKP